MIEYVISETHITDKTKKRLSEQLGEGREITAVLSFDQSYVMERKGPDFSGLLVITGPLLEYHIFRKVGMKFVHAGAMKTSISTVSLSDDNYNAMAGLGVEDKLTALSHKVKELHPHILAYFKTEEMKGVL
ncbi:hypothetical protein 2050HW_00194 [Serratia phage vB_SmaM_ 2050HW]|uniref:Uncharacterized protein n=1 Tax=Serratia phage vB_SmaM_ 2050HW TaxID=2024252 RepID=A0A289YZ53_9CAUD|nr:hypothetical protein HWB23_gp194 [Serratia phage vB_SmaM_ 2050HW]ATA65529.1 hypothetical protein 2050HW_00194 [Serratia phage vB_SmaM_ 2050HW]UCR74785.1 hypothetical protein [Serratia phage BUCT660]